MSCNFSKPIKQEDQKVLETKQSEKEDSMLVVVDSSESSLNQLTLNDASTVRNLKLKEKAVTEDDLKPSWGFVKQICKGDLNNDGKEDLFCVFLEGTQQTEKIQEDIYDDDAYEEVYDIVGIYLSDEHGAFSLFAQYDSIMRESLPNESFDLEILINDKQQIEINNSIFYTAGSYTSPSCGYKFQLIDNKFQLAEYYYKEFSRSDLNSYSWHRNYITGDSTYKITYNDPEEERINKGKKIKYNGTFPGSNSRILGEFLLF